MSRGDSPTPLSSVFSLRPRRYGVPFLHPLAYAVDVDRDGLGSEEDGPRGVAEPFCGSHDVGPRPSGVGALESERVAFAEVALDLVVDKLAGGALERRVVGVAEAFGDRVCVVERLGERLAMLAGPSRLACVRWRRWRR